MRKSRLCDIPSIFLDAPVKMTHHETYMNLWDRGTVARYCWDSHWGYRMNTPRCGTCHSLNWFCSSDHGCHFPSMFFCLNWFKLCKDLQAMCVRLQDYIYTCLFVRPHWTLSLHSEFRSFDNYYNMVELSGAINSLSAWACHVEFCFGLWQDAMMHAKISLKLRVSHEDSLRTQGQSF